MNQSSQIGSSDIAGTVGAIVESAWDGIVFQNLDGKIFEVNSRFCAMTGFSRDEIIGRAPPYPYWPEEESAGGERFSGELPPGGPIEHGRIFKRKTGERFPVMIRVAPILDASRKPAGHVLTVKDVSERKRAEIVQRERARAAEFHRDLALVFTGGRRLPEVLQRCAEAMVEHLNAALARIWTMDPEEGVLELQASAGTRTGIDGPQSRIPLGKSKIGTIALERRPQLIHNVTGDASLCDPGWASREHIRAFAGYPLILDNRVLGVIGLFAREPLNAGVLDDLSSAAVALAQEISRKQSLARLEAQNRQQAKEKEEHFRALIENSTELITVLDRAGGIRYQSPTVQRTLGYQPDELAHWNAFDLIHPDDRDPVLRVFAAALQNEGGVYSAEYRIRHKSGAWRYMESVGRSLLDSPPILGVIVNSRDVTDRKRTERLLHESEENLRQVTDNINQVFWLTDPGKNEMVYVSPAYEAIWGRSRASLCAKPVSWIEAIHPDDQARVVRATMAKQAFGAYDEQYRVVRPDGTIRWIRDRAFPVHDASGKPLRIAGIAEDITERKETEEALAERERQLSTIISNLRGLVYRCRYGADYTMEFISDGVGELTGYPADDFRQRRRRFGDVVHPDDRDEVWERIQAAVGADRPFELTYRIRTAAGVDKWVWERGIGVRDASAKLQALEGFITDITELKRAEQALKSAYAELKQSNTIKTEFLSIMSHELRTPLNVIMGYTAILRETLGNDAEPSSFTAVRKIEAQANELLNMINSIMQATAIESETARLYLQTVNPSALLEELRSTYEYADEQRLTLRWNYPASLPTLRTDPDKLKHVLQNLINNALKFSAGGAVTVSARATFAASEEGGSADSRVSSIQEPGTSRRAIEFAVADTGIGIAQENLATIFAMFHQVDSSVRREYEGIGLGLYIVKKYTELMGGTIAVESEVEKGSTFTVILPVDPV